MYKTNVGNNNLVKGIIVGFVVSSILFGIIFLFSRCGKDDKKDIEISNENSFVETYRPNEVVVINENSINANINEANENSNVNELNKEDVGGEEYTDTFNGQKFSFIVLDGFQINETEKNKVGLVDLLDSTANNKGNIVFTFKSNKQSYDFDRFYDGLNDVNYFSDSSGGFEKLKVNGLDAYKFKNVAGYSNSTVISVKTNGGYVEISDLTNKYQSNGTFEKIVQSFNIK
ncbi:MAG: hypothetical protein PHN19_02345 [Patescibacteria group bacterium]|nr:hypothetical protein [Patescibacteria group bacterium]